MMEKGKIINLKLKEKNETISGYIQVKGKKTLIHSNEYLLSMEMNNQECDVLIVNGNKFGSVLFNENEIMKNPTKGGINSKSNKRKSKTKAKKIVKTKKTYSHAPYNFIRLNKQVVPVDTPGTFDKYSGNTGFIDLDIETKTPIYIRGKGSDFYQQAGKYRIPGSSLRGMIRTIVEIVSWSKFGFVNDHYLYYRTFADKSHRVRDEYKNNMIPEDEEGHGQYLMKSGLLYKKGLNYFIIPEDKPFEQIKKPDSEKKIRENRMHYSLSSSYNVGNNTYIVVPGRKFKPADKSKQNDWYVFANPQNKTNAVMIPEKDILNFRNDSNSKAPKILEQTAKKEVPCFYVNWTDKKGENRISFGHTPLFRLSYFKSIGEHIIQDSEDDKKYDFAETMFGMKTNFATRLFFEDLIIKTVRNIRDEKISKILASPNPTSFQIYLYQKESTFMEDLRHYNDETEIRGNKLYWHKKLPEWSEDVIILNKNAFESNLKRKSIDLEVFRKSIVRDEKGKLDIKLSTLSKENYLIIMEMIKEEIRKEKREIETQHSVISPISEGNKFSGKIRFENLTDEELGALLFALDLPKECCHKIGMGKPIGLGSIKITPKLFLSNRKDRYKNLLSGFSNLQEESDTTINSFKNGFEKYIFSYINKSDYKSLWQVDRMNEFKRMLTFNHNINIQEKLSYVLDMKEYRDRKVLPKPTEVK